MNSVFGLLPVVRNRFERTAPGEHHDRLSAHQATREKLGGGPMQERLALVELNRVRSRCEGHRCACSSLTSGARRWSGGKRGNLEHSLQVDA